MSGVRKLRLGKRFHVYVYMTDLNIINLAGQFSTMLQATDWHVNNLETLPKGDWRFIIDRHNHAGELLDPAPEPFQPPRVIVPGDDTPGN